MKPRPYSKELDKNKLLNILGVYEEELEYFLPVNISPKIVDELLALIKQEKIELLGRVLELPAIKEIAEYDEVLYRRITAESQQRLRD